MNYRHTVNWWCKREKAWSDSFSIIIKTFKPLKKIGILISKKTSHSLAEFIYYLMVLLQYVVHFCYIFTCYSFDDISFVVRRMKAGTTACLGIIGKGCTSCQWILSIDQKASSQTKVCNLFRAHINNLHLLKNIFQYICTKLNSEKHVFIDYIIMRKLFKNIEKKSMFEEEGIAHQWFKTHPQCWMRIYWTLVHIHY